MRRLVFRAAPSAFDALELGDGKNRDGRRSHSRSVAAGDSHTRDDPLADHDATRAGIRELARPQRLQAVDVWYLVRRDDNAGGPGIHHHTIAALTEQDAQPGYLRDVVEGTGPVFGEPAEVTESPSRSKATAVAARTTSMVPVTAATPSPALGTRPREDDAGLVPHVARS